MECKYIGKSTTYHFIDEKSRIRIFDSGVDSSLCLVITPTGCKPYTRYFSSTDELSGWYKDLGEKFKKIKDEERDALILSSIHGCVKSD